MCHLNGTSGTLRNQRYNPFNFQWHNFGSGYQQGIIKRGKVTHPIYDPMSMWMALHVGLGGGCRQTAFQVLPENIYSDTPDKRGIKTQVKLWDENTIVK